MNLGFDLIAANIGLGFGDTILIILTLGSFIFIAKDFRIGIFMLMLSSGGLFMGLYALQEPFALSLIVFMCSIVILALSLISLREKTAYGGMV